MLHRTTHPTTLTAVCNVAVAIVVSLALYVTHDPLVLLGLFTVRELPRTPEEINLKMAEFATQAGDEDDDPGDYQGSNIGFTAHP